MAGAITIDVMREEDVPAVAAMEGPTRMGEEQVREELQRAWSRSWVARESVDGSSGGTVVVGFLMAWHVADEIHVLNVAARADRRRRGIGRALMDGVVGYGRAGGVRHVLLEVRRSNVAALTLYRAIGFYAIGMRTRYYADDEDAIEMLLAFDPVTGAVARRPDEIHLDGTAASQSADGARVLQRSSS